MKYKAPELTESQAKALQLIADNSPISHQTAGYHDYYIIKQEKILLKDLQYLNYQDLVDWESDLGTSVIKITETGKAWLAGEWEDPNAVENDEYLKQDFDNQDFEPDEIMEPENNIYDESFEHESFGVVSLSHRQGDTTLFNCTVPQFNTICLTISTATMYRGLNRDTIHGGKEIIEIEMSHDQLLDFIFTPNRGSGTPCTINHIHGKRMESPPKAENKRGQFSKEYRQTLSKAFKASVSLQEEANRLLSRSGTLKKAEKERLKGLMNQIGNATKSNLAFAEEQFQEQMDKSVAEATTQVQGAINAQLQHLGLEALQDKIKAPQIEG
jgi:hypothetical protein